MGVFASMLTGVSGLMGQSTKMGSISDNIANVNTVGYKRADVPFQTLVTERMTSTNYAPGGTLSRPRMLIDQQGILQSTSHTMDFAISGNGFFTVTDDEQGGTDATKMYTRAGSFRPAIDPEDSAKALLRNTAGYYLMGWSVDSSGTTTSASETMDALEVVDIHSVVNTAEATEQIAWRGNLPAETEASAAVLTFKDATTGNTTFGDTVAFSSGGTYPALDIGTTPGLASQNWTMDFGDADGDTNNEYVSIYTDAGGDWYVDVFEDGVSLGGGYPYQIGNNGDTLDTIIANLDSAGTAMGLTTEGIAITPSSDVNEGKQIELTFELNSSGQMQIQAYDVAAGGRTAGSSAEIQLPTGVLSQNGAGITATTPVADATLMQLAAAAADPTVTAVEGGEVWDSDYEYTYTVFDSLGSSHNVTYEFKKRMDDPNTWEVRLSDNNVTGTSDNFDFNNGQSNNGARFGVVDSNGNTIQTQRLFMKFNGDGALREARTTLDGQPGATMEDPTNTTATSGTVANRTTVDSEPPKLVSVVLGPATSSATTSEPLFTPDSVDSDNYPFKDAESAMAISYEWDIGRPTGLSGEDAGTGLDGLTQFDSGEVDPTIESFFFEQDGARYGTLNGISISEEGLLYAHYDNGLSRSIYRIPLATFANPNGLIAESGNAYLESPDSGSVQIKYADDEGAGQIVGSALENSNVDLGDEFTNMIITQQAFTANTRTITTSDRMLEELVRILR